MSHRSSLAFRRIAGQHAGKKINQIETLGRIQQVNPDCFFFQTQGRTVIGLGPFQRLDVSGTSFLGQLGELGKLVHSDETHPIRRAYGHGFVLSALPYDLISSLEPILQGSGYFRAGPSQPTEALLATRLIVLDENSSDCFLFSDRGEDDLGRLAELLSGTMTEEEEPGEQPRFELSRLRQTLGRAKYKQRALTIKRHIRAGDIFQAVLSEQVELDVQASAFEIFKELHAIQATPCRFFISIDGRELFGSSPESLVSSRNGRLCTHPIAGTRPRGLTADQDLANMRELLKCEKEAAEHLMLVDLARNDLGRVAKIGTVEVTSFRAVQKFSRVMHLVSEVQADLQDGVPVAKALASCFPAGTLTGAPKIRAMQILSELEPTPRGFYGGAIAAFTGDGDMESYILIRFAEMQNGKLRVRAGAGIVADSDVDLEYDESMNKMQAMFDAVAKAEARKHHTGLQIRMQGQP